MKKSYPCAGGCGVDCADGRNYYCFQGTVHHCVPCGIIYLTTKYPGYWDPGWDRCFDKDPPPKKEVFEQASLL